MEEGKNKPLSTTDDTLEHGPCTVHYYDVFGYGAPRATVHEDRFIVDEGHLAER